MDRVNVEDVLMSPVNPSLVAQRIQTSDLSPGEKRKALDNFGHAHSDEIAILFGLFDLHASWKWPSEVLSDPRARTVRGPDYAAGEILCGAHVRIWDNGAHYDCWRCLRSADDRHSSHHSEGKQYHVDGPLVHTALFGRIGPWTWVQLERHPWDFRHFFGHTFDAIKYAASHENQGPYGSSRYTERRYIEVLPHDPD
jgi:hypothetical protein